MLALTLMYGCAMPGTGSGRGCGEDEEDEGGKDAGEIVKKCVASISASRADASVGSVGKSLGNERVRRG